MPHTILTIPAGNAVRFGLGVILSGLLLLALPLSTAAQAADDPAQAANQPAPAADTPADATDGPETPGLKPGWLVAGFPLVFSTPETGFAGGLGAILTYRRVNAPPESRPQTITLLGFYTAKKQYQIAALPELYFDRETWTIRGALSYRKWPNVFFGIGNNTSADDKEDFTTQDGGVMLTFLGRALASLRLGINLNIENTNIVQVEEDGALAQQDIPGTEGGVLASLGPVFEWDSRDNSFYPSRGSWHQIYAGYYDKSYGSDYNYRFYTLDLRSYYSLWPRQILAAQLLIISQRGIVPFYKLAPLGEYLRGYLPSRYIDKALGMAQVEFRFPIKGRFLGVVFAGAGEVAPSLDAYRLDELKPAVGGGLRFAISPAEKINLRFDMGVGQDGTEIYFQFREAF